MASVTLRSVKGTPLTQVEMDANWTAINDELEAATAAIPGKADASHTHSIANVTGLQSALDGKQDAGSYAAASHTHTMSEVTGLQTQLDGKQDAGSYANASHTHTIANVTGLQTALDAKQDAATSNVMEAIATGTLVIGVHYLLNSGGDVTLPNTGLSDGSLVQISTGLDVSSGSTAVIRAGSEDTIEGDTTLTLDVARTTLWLRFASSTQRWEIY